LARHRPSIIVVREPEMGTFLSEFFGNGVLVWFAGGLLLFSGLLIIAFHQYWSSPSMILISLFGWFLALRGFVLMAAPQPIERGAAASMGAMPLVRIGFGILALIGLWLTFVGWITKPAAPPAKDRPRTSPSIRRRAFASKPAIGFSRRWVCRSTP
jgi:uncharacterized membrane protein